jgi:GntR family transcriptional regulator of vanillate catabolism
MDEVAEAIDVRGVLEGFAARRIAEEGLSPEHLDIFKSCVREGRELLEAANESGGTPDVAGWASTNARFHLALADAAQSKALKAAIVQVTKAPMAGAGALGINGAHPSLELSYLRRAQCDHEDILMAMVAREGARAEALVREHARRSRDNKLNLAQQVTSLLSGGLAAEGESSRAQTEQRHRLNGASGTQAIEPAKKRSPGP